MLPDCTTSDPTAPRAEAVGWDQLPEASQLLLAQEALRRAGEVIAGFAQVLAAEIEGGDIPDHGGPDALRLLVAIIRLTGRDVMAPAGCA